MTLQQRMTEYLRERSVDREYAERAGLRAVDTPMSRTMGFAPALPGIVIPYLHPLSREPHKTLMRIRYFDPPVIGGKERRYAQPKDSGVEAFFDCNVDWACVLPDVHATIVITEGEVKALALNQRRDALGVVTIAIGGVWMFKAREADDLTPWLRAMRELGRGREYIIAFDSDMATNPDVRAAALRLTELLV